MITVKPGVVFKVLLPCIYNIFPIIDKIYKDNSGKELTITSANDSTHMKQSKHYDNCAIDLRSKELSELEKDNVFSALKTALNPMGYDVIFESRGKTNEHFHIEYDPK